MANDQAKDADGRARNFAPAALLKSDPRRGAGGDPAQVHGYCCGSYRLCGIWRSEKARIAERRDAIRAADAGELSDRERATA